MDKIVFTPLLMTEKLFQIISVTFAGFFPNNIISQFILGDRCCQWVNVVKISLTFSASDPNLKSKQRRP